jgi:RNA polymerase sigma-70 factor, ECF subfamily
MDQAVAGPTERRGSDGDQGASTAIGRREAYALLVRQYGEPLWRYCFHRLHDRQLAEDATQEAFLRYWRDSESRPPADPGPWLFGVARHCCQESARRRRRAVEQAGELTESIMAPFPGPADLTLDDLIEGLEDWPRMLLFLKHGQSMTCREIAELTGRPIGTVTSDLCRAHAKLREMSASEEQRKPTTTLRPD